MGKIFAGVMAVIVVLAAAVFGTVETGLFDGPLSKQAQIALNQAIGPNYTAEVGTAGVRFTSSFHLALEARNVNMTDRKSGKHLSTTGAVRMALDPLGLLRGRIAVTAIEAEEIGLDTALLPASEPVRLEDLRVDGIPAAAESVFAGFDNVQQIIARGGTNSIRVEDIRLKFAQPGQAPLSIVIEELKLARASAASLQLDGVIRINGVASTLSAVARIDSGRTSGLTLRLTNADLAPFFLKKTELGVIRQGLDAKADIEISATRGGDGQKPNLSVNVKLAPGQIFADAIAQPLGGGKVALSYNFDHQTLEILRSNAQFGPTNIPFNGAIIDLDRLDSTAPKGFGIDALISGGTSAAAGADEAPMTFDLKATGRYLASTRELEFRNMTVSTPQGALYGSLHLRLADSSPEVSFAAQSPMLQTSVIKQLWPFWMAGKARTWVLDNLFGGTVTDAAISVFIPEGALEAAIGKPLKLDENQLHISFDIANARMNVAGDIPPIRDTNAHFDLKGPRATIGIRSGTSFFSSGRTVKLGEGEFVLPAIYDKPLMAETMLQVSGSADAVGELLTYKPIKVLDRAGFAPGDLSGDVKADVEARFGLISGQDPPPAEWKASMDLTNVVVSKPVSGHKLTDIDGHLDADPKLVKLDAEARIDGVPAQIALTEPTDKLQDADRKSVITLTLDNSQRESLMPGLSDIVDGPVTVELTRIDGNRQAVKLDLRQATLNLPWIGWSKGSGIPASATLEVSGPADNLSIKNLQLKGDGFGAVGDLSVGKGGLSSASFSNVKLSAADSFAVDVKRTKGAYDISVYGKAADARPVLSQLKSSNGKGSGSKDDSIVTVRVKLDKVVGFNNESIGNFDGVVVNSGGRLRKLDFTAVTDSGQAFVSKTNGDGSMVHITSGDAGSTSRFLDLYQHIRGGLLNVTVQPGAGSDWDGAIDLRSFQLVNEQRLRSIVSTPVGQDRRSLNSAVRRDIDTTAQRFQRGFARIFSRGGIVGIENGVLRGDQVGATFQGVIRDTRGNMDMTGTFMPAYGLNRLFAELPIIGIILGNGSDRGLIGITFRLTGNFDTPKLTINPLSIIAPGVFRQIFEFQ